MRKAERGLISVDEMLPHPKKECVHNWILWSSQEVNSVKFFFAVDWRWSTIIIWPSSGLLTTKTKQQVWKRCVAHSFSLSSPDNVTSWLQRWLGEKVREMVTYPCLWQPIHVIWPCIPCINLICPLLSCNNFKWLLHFFHFKVIKQKDLKYLQMRILLVSFKSLCKKKANLSYN